MSGHMAEALTDFTPNDHQLAVLTAMRDSDYACTVTAACEKAGIARRSYYDWFDSPRFRAWWVKQCETHFALRLHAVLANLAEGASRRYAGGKNPDAKPDAALIRTFLERFDEKFRPTANVNAKVKVGRDLTDLTDEELRRLAEATQTPLLPTSERANDGTGGD